MRTTKDTINKINDRLEINSITLDVIRKLPDGTMYTEPVTFLRREIKAYGPRFDKSVVLVESGQKKCWLELNVNKNYKALSEELGNDSFEKVKLV